MGRYLRVLAEFWGTSLSAEMEYRANFALAVMTSSGGLAGNLFALSLFYRQGYTFEGWSWEEALVVLGISNLLLGVSESCLAPNLSQIVAHVRTGSLDFVLLKPIDAQLWLSGRVLSPWGLPDLALGVGMILYAGVGLERPILAYLALGPPLVCGIILLYSLWFMLGTMSIWFVRVYNATAVLEALMRAGRYPMGAYPLVFRTFFTFVVPVAFMTTVPAEAFLGRAEGVWIGGSALLAGAALVGSRLFWRFALRFYTSASS